MQKVAASVLCLRIQNKGVIRLEIAMDMLRQVIKRMEDLREAAAAFLHEAVDVDCHDTLRAGCDTAGAERVC